MGKNITQLMHKYNLVIDEMKSLSKHSLSNHVITSGCLASILNGQIIEDIIGMKEKCYDECQCIIDFCSID